MDCKPEKDWWDKYKIVEILGVLIFSVYTFLTLKISGANTEAAKAATQTAKDTEAFFKVDERAWVVLDIACENHLWLLSEKHRQNGSPERKPSR